MHTRCRQFELCAFQTIIINSLIFVYLPQEHTFLYISISGATGLLTKPKQICPQKNLKTTHTVSLV